MLYLVPTGDNQNPHQDIATITSMQCDVNIRIALTETGINTVQYTVQLIHSSLINQ